MRDDLAESEDALNRHNERVDAEVDRLLGLRSNDYSKFITQWRNLRDAAEGGSQYSRMIIRTYGNKRSDQIRAEAKRHLHAFNYGMREVKMQTTPTQELNMNPAYTVTIKYKKRNTYSKMHNLSAYWNLPSKGYTYIPDMETPQLISCAYWLRARLKERVADVSRGLARSIAYAETDRIDSIISNASLDDWSLSWQHIKAELIRRNLQTIINEVES